MTGRLINFLKALEAAVPPPPHCHHALTYARYGSEEKGWEDRLALQIAATSSEVTGEPIFYCLFLDDDDLCKPVDELIIEIVVVLNTPDPAAQTSDTPTRYFPHE